MSWNRRRPHQAKTAGAIMALLILMSACASQTAQSPERIALVQATGEIPQEQILDVVIEELNPGLPPEGQPVPEDVFPELREAESRYIAIQLKKTMQGTGQWGAVRVLPKGHGVADLEVTGTIVLSTGSKIALDIRAIDATGKVLLEQRYRADADEAVYMSTGDEAGDPFQYLYNEISNDILHARQKLDAADLATVRQVSRMRFAAELSPTPFETYLSTDKKGRFSVNRLPARDDPMMKRVDTIRASDYLFVDTLDQYYAAFFDNMAAPYASWRKYTYEEEQAYKALKRKALTQKILGGLAILGAIMADPGSPATAVVRDAAMIGGMAAIHAGIGTSKEAKIHAEAIRELAVSVETELEPIVIQVEGQTLRLSGTAATQYQDWRRLLQEIWTTETGLPQDPNKPLSEVPGNGGGSSSQQYRESR